MEQIFKKFLVAIRGGDYPLLPEDVAMEELVILLEMAISRFPYPKQDLDSFNPETGWTFQLSRKEESILVGLMLENWLTSAINGLDLATVDMTTSEIKTFSKNGQITSIIKWRTNVQTDTARLIELYHKEANNKPTFHTLGGDGSGGQ